MEGGCDVGGEDWMEGGCEVEGEGWMEGGCKVGGEGWMEGGCKVGGEGWMEGGCKVGGEGWMEGGCKVGGEGWMEGGCKVGGEGWMEGGLDKKKKNLKKLEKICSTLPATPARDAVVEEDGGGQGDGQARRHEKHVTVGGLVHHYGNRLSIPAHPAQQRANLFDWLERLDGSL